MNDALGFTIDVFELVSLRGNNMILYLDSNINQRVAELGEYKIFGDLAYRGRNHSHSASYGPYRFQLTNEKRVKIYRMELYDNGFFVSLHRYEAGLRIGLNRAFIS